VSYKKELIFKVAKLYYIDEFKQEKIARSLNISKYKVSRVLKKAKKEGIVQIKIINPKDN
jgi:deoxyribonucleoside regulator